MDFLKDAEENYISAVVVRSRKLEVGLLVPARFVAVAKEMTVEAILSNENFNLSE